MDKPHQVFKKHNILIKLYTIFWSNYIIQYICKAIIVQKAANKYLKSIWSWFESKLSHNRNANVG